MEATESVVVGNIFVNEILQIKSDGHNLDTEISEHQIQIPN